MNVLNHVLIIRKKFIQCLWFWFLLKGGGGLGIVSWKRHGSFQDELVTVAKDSSSTSQPVYLYMIVFFLNGGLFDIYKDVKKLWIHHFPHHFNFFWNYICTYSIKILMIIRSKLSIGRIKYYNKVRILIKFMVNNSSQTIPSLSQVMSNFNT